LVLLVPETIRRTSAWSQVMLRPPGARNCNSFNRGGDYSGRVGMPSGHVLITAFTCVSSSLIFVARGTLGAIAAAAVAVCAVTLMSASRVKRGCHTVFQTIAGGTIGTSFAMLWMRLYPGEVLSSF
jgi:membrane-associated phospholipid phosphatase